MTVPANVLDAMGVWVRADVAEAEALARMAVVNERRSIRIEELDDLPSGHRKSAAEIEFDRVLIADTDVAAAKLQHCREAQLDAMDELKQAMRAHFGTPPRPRQAS